MRLLSRSATHTLPPVSTARPSGSRNWPGPVPMLPQVRRNSGSAAAPGAAAPRRAIPMPPMTVALRIARRAATEQRLWVRVGGVRSTRHAAAACALGLALLVPAIPLTAQEADQPAPDSARPTLTPSNVSPDAALTAAESDGTVAFDASASADPDGSVVSYEWDLNGDSVYEKDTGAEPRVENAYEPGTTLIASVRVTDDAGASDDATAAVVVAAAPEPAAEPAASPAPAEQAPLVPTRELEDQPKPEPKAVKASREHDEAGDPPVNAAASKGVTISDFEFTPATVNVSVGDTVTWTNRGPTNHTATANNGSFDSGNLNRGQTYSRKFTAAGTFTYFCEPHPFMTGRVVVGSGSSGGGSDSGSGSGGGGSGGSSGSGGSGDAAGAGADSGSTADSGGLAKTGVDLIPWSLFGFSLLVFGAAMRYRLTAD